MRHLVFTGLGVGFILMGAALFALTFRKAKPTPINPNKAQLREQAALAADDTSKAPDPSSRRAHDGGAKPDNKPANAEDHP